METTENSTFNHVINLRLKNTPRGHLLGQNVNLLLLNVQYVQTLNAIGP